MGELVLRHEEFEFRTLTRDDIPALGDHIWRYYKSEVSGLLMIPYRNWMNLIICFMSQEGVLDNSIKIVHKESREFVGCLVFVLPEVNRSLSLTLDTLNRIEPILKLVRYVDNKLFEFSKLDPKKGISLQFGSVSPKYEGKKLMVLAVKCAEKIAKKKGYTYVYGESVHERMHRVANFIGCKVYYEIRLRDFNDPAGKVFSGLNGVAKGVVKHFDPKL